MPPNLPPILFLVLSFLRMIRGMDISWRDANTCVNITTPSIEFMTEPDRKFLLTQIFDRQNTWVQFRIGFSFLTGRNVPKAYPLIGRYLMTMAANNGHKRAMWVLQIGYCAGRWGFPQNDEKGMYWGRKHVSILHHEVDNGDEGAIEMLRVLDDYRMYKIEWEGRAVTNCFDAEGL
jgi:hypothetical protein